MINAVDVQKCSEFGQCGNATNWYVINTNPKCEDLVQRILSNESLEVFLPKIPRKSSKKVHEPLFPGYLFARLNINSHDWLKVKYLQGVRKILSFGSNPVPLSEEIVANIKYKITDGNFEKELLSFKTGDKVRFTKGPFEGLEGIFTGEISGKERVRVLLKAICSWAFTVEAKAVELSKAN